ncbi:MAG: nucleotidyltransferase domain-containing protein, partial [Terriglobales bacterium]
MELDEARSARAQVLLAGELDWNTLLKLASRHALAPLLHWHLSRRFPGRAPQSAAHLLAEQFRANVQSNLKLAAELIRVLKLLEGEKIFAIPFKGPALTAALYGNLALRESSDLDLLLRPDHVLPARDVLLADGYVPEYDLTPAQERALLRSDCQYTFQKFDGQLRIELHWDIVPRYCGVRLDPARWFERAQSITLTSVTVPSLSPEDLLLVLCVHGAKHAWERAAWIVDVAELLRVYPALDFTYVAQQASAARARRHLRVGLGLAHQLLEVQLPPEFAREIEQDAMARSL